VVRLGGGPRHCALEGMSQSRPAGVFWQLVSCGLRRSYAPARTGEPGRDPCRARSLAPAAGLCQSRSAIV